ncbi:MAG: hypothetical protein GWP04_05465 [Gammaproteobacteria bacterium]|nr:hypothetical protein [Gammaproteobacteria bacterium]
MLTATGLAWGYASGVPLVVLALAGLAVYKPGFALGVIAGLVLFGRYQAKSEECEGAFLQAVAAELRAGAGLRLALADASERVPSRSLASVARLARAGRPLDELADALAGGLERHGALTAAAVRIAGTTGGRVADTFDELALLAAEDMYLEGERRAATAQARISAWIVGGLPVAYLAYSAGSGRLSVLWNAGTIGAVVLGVGGLLLLSGVGGIVLMVRRADR